MDNGNLTHGRDGFGKHPENIYKKGRPKGKSFKSIIERIMALPAAQKIKNLSELKDIIGDTNNLTNDEALAVRMLAKALANPDSKSAERLLNHGYGMPKQVIEQQVVFDKPQIQTAIDGDIISLKVLSPSPPELPLSDEFPTE